MVFQCIDILQVPRKVLKTAASGLGFQHLPRDLANVNVWKTMFDPYIANQKRKISYGKVPSVIKPYSETKSLSRMRSYSIFCRSYFGHELRETYSQNGSYDDF